MENETNYDSAWGQWLRDLGGAEVRNWMQTQSPNGPAPVNPTTPSTTESLSERNSRPSARVESEVMSPWIRSETDWPLPTWKK